MKRLFALALVSVLLTACAVTHVADAPPPTGPAEHPVRTPVDAEHTASIVGIQVGKHIAAFVFIARDGKHFNASADQCASSEKCKDLMASLGKDGRTDLIQFTSTCDADDEQPKEGGLSFTPQ